MVQEKESAEIVQLVVAKLADEEYGIPIIQVQEIIKIPEITRIPGMPEFIEGVINLRGKIIPIVDLRKRFNLEHNLYDEQSRIVVSSIANQSVGLVVDSVSEVIRLPQDAIEPVPQTISQISGEYLSGVGKLGKRLIILLNIEKILTDIEKMSLKKIEKDISSEIRS